MRRYVHDHPTREFGYYLDRREKRVAAREISGNKQAVARRFGMAEGYHRLAEVQRQVAHCLMERIRPLPLPGSPRILETGCGTGLLSQMLLDHFADGQFIFSDLSLPMVKRAMERLQPEKGRSFVAMDGENIALTGGFDLIASSLAVQWFEQPEKTVSDWIRLLNPGGMLAMAGLGRETFREWRAACTLAGVPCRTPVYPTLTEFHTWGEGEGQTEEVFITVHRPSALSFFQGLRAVGAHGTLDNGPPLSGTQLRRALRAADGGERVTMTYHVLLRTVGRTR